MNPTKTSDPASAHVPQAGQADVDQADTPAAADHHADGQWFIDKASGVGPGSPIGQYDQLSPVFRRHSNAPQVFGRVRGEFERLIRAASKECKSVPRLATLRKEQQQADADMHKAAGELAEVQRRKEALLQKPTDGFGLELEKFEQQIDKLQGARARAERIIDGLTPAIQEAESDFWAEMIQEAEAINQAMASSMNRRREGGLRGLARVVSAQLSQVQDAETGLRALRGMTGDMIPTLQRILGLAFRRKVVNAPDVIGEVRGPGVYPVPSSRRPENPVPQEPVNVHAMAPSGYDALKTSQAGAPQSPADAEMYRLAGERAAKLTPQRT